MLFVSPFDSSKNLFIVLLRNHNWLLLIEMNKNNLCRKYYLFIQNNPQYSAPITNIWYEILSCDLKGYGAGHCLGIEERQYIHDTYYKWLNVFVYNPNIQNWEKIKVCKMNFCAVTSLKQRWFRIGHPASLFFFPCR